MSSTVITARIDAETSTTLDALSERLSRSRAWLVARAVERFVKEEAEFLAFVQVGLDDVVAGRVQTQDEVERQFGVRRPDRDAA